MRVLFTHPQVLLVLVSNLTGRKTEYSHDDVHMVIADVMAVTFFIFTILTPQIWVKVVSSISGVSSPITSIHAKRNP